MSKMRSFLKPPLPKSPIRLRSRQVLHSNTSSLQTPQGYGKPRRLSDTDLKSPKIPLEYSAISNEIHALAKQVKDEFAKQEEEEEDRKKSRVINSNLENLAADSVPIFERGRFYEEYSARRNERLRRKKGDEIEQSSTSYNLGVTHEPMTNKKRTTMRKSIIKKTTTTVSMVETTTPRYSLRSITKDNKKPPPTPSPLNHHLSAIKTITTRKGRRI